MSVSNQNQERQVVLNKNQVFLIQKAAVYLGLSKIWNQQSQSQLSETSNKN